MNSRKISELYETGYISGEAFLDCVEKNLYTVQDVIDAGILEDPVSPYGGEFAQLLDSTDDVQPQSEPQVLEDDNSEVLANNNLDAKIEDFYNIAILDVDVRTVNALTKMRTRYEDFKSYLNAFIHNDDKFWVTFMSLQAVGQKSIIRAHAFANYLRSEIESILQLWDVPICPVEDVRKENEEIKEDVNLDELEILFKAKLQELTTRSYNAIISIYTECECSLTIFYKKITDPKFNVRDIDNVGRKSSEEIRRWFAELKVIIEAYKEKGITEEQRESYALLHLSQLGIMGDRTKILQLSETLGYFPYFYAILSYFDTLIERDRKIIKYQLDFFAKKELCSLKDASILIGLTSERVRQLRSVILDTIKKYIENLSQRIKDYPMPLSYYNLEEDNINLAEGTSFNGDFIRWVVSILAPQDYVLIGDIEDAFVNPYGRELPLVLVSERLNKVFDFEGFINYLSDINAEKRVDDISIVLVDCVLGFFKGRTYYEYLDDIVQECKSIVTILFDFEIFNEAIHISKNSDRNNPELVEIILRDVGHSMTLDEIYAEFQKRYPNRTKSADALAGALRLNPNIACVGRSRTYTLTEYTQGQHRGGTIREFATEYLLSLPYPIAPMEDIGNYVRKFRPTSSDKSIHANLLLEGAFAVFYKDGIRCMGFVNYDYPDEYVKAISTSSPRRDFRTSCTLLEQFVAENGRLPFSQSAEEEQRLSRFWKMQCYKLEKDLFDNEEERAIIEKMIERFRGLNISKKDYDWIQICNKIKEHFRNGYGYDSLSEDDRRWLDTQLSLLRYRRAPENRIDSLIELATLIANAQ